MRVTEIGLKSERVPGLGIFGTGVITAVSHWIGTTPVRLEMSYEYEQQHQQVQTSK
jgi:hypothetical protein